MASRLCSWLVLLLTASFLVSCQASEPILPADVVARVAEDSRERNYDLAWQEIAALNGALEREQLSGLTSDALLVTARMERLHRGRPANMGDWTSLRKRDQLIEQGRERSDVQLLAHARDTAQALRERFDAGDFESAKWFALDLTVTLQLLAEKVRRPQAWR